MSLLITGGTAAARIEKAKKIADGLVFEVSGIDEVRDIEKNIFLGQSVIIANGQDLTPEAQNAFLKTLEEPPKNVEIILLAENEDQLLPTILSRVQIIELNEKIKVDLSNDEEQILKWIGENDFKNGSIWAQNIKDRVYAIQIIDKFLTTKPFKIIRKLLKAKKYLKANTNVRLTLENLFIN